MENNCYDVIVIGGGPGGYCAALYAARANLKTLVIEKFAPGGQMATTEIVENYPGFVDGINGFELGMQMKKGAERFGVKTKLAEVKSVELSENPKLVHTAKDTFEAKTVILALGAFPRELGLENERNLRGRGVSYCATCDGMFYRDKTVAVVGGGNSAADNALILSRICRQVILVHRKDKLQATKIYRDALMQASNIRFCWDHEVIELLSDKKLTGVRLRNRKTGEEQALNCDGVFVSIGRIPATELVKGQLAMDERGYVVADESTRTSVPGVFAVGDVRTKSLRQIVTAVADGAVAIYYAEEYLTHQGV